MKLKTLLALLTGIAAIFFVTPANAQVSNPSTTCRCSCSFGGVLRNSSSPAKDPRWKPLHLSEWNVGMRQTGRRRRRYYSSDGPPVEGKRVGKWRRGSLAKRRLSHPSPVR